MRTGATLAGNRIPGGIQVTVYAAAKIAKGTIVEIVDPYKVAVPSAAGSDKILGMVMTDQKNAGDEFIVEARGKAIQTLKCGAAISAPGPVVIDDEGKVIPLTALSLDVTEATGDLEGAVADVAFKGNADRAIYGLALTETAEADELVDVLVY